MPEKAWTTMAAAHILQRHLNGWYHGSIINFHVENSREPPRMECSAALSGGESGSTRWSMARVRCFERTIRSRSSLTTDRGLSPKRSFVLISPIDRSSLPCSPPPRCIRAGGSHDPLVSSQPNVGVSVSISPFVLIAPNQFTLFPNDPSRGYHSLSKGDWLYLRIIINARKREKEKGVFYGRKYFFASYPLRLTW